MSASPSTAMSATAATTKRPLDDESSTSGPTDQPDAKRPALDKAGKEEGASADQTPVVATNGTDAVKTEDDAAAAALPNGQSDGTAKPTTEAAAAASQPASTTDAAQAVKTEGQTDANANTTSTQATPQDESSFLHMRSVISSAEAATVIGKGGENVSQIRRHSGAKCTISDYSRGAVERVLTVSGPVDAVAKAFGLIIRTLNNEPLEAASTSQSKTYPLRLLVPHILIGSVIGKSGVRIREIQEASGARLNASDSCLPLSTERSLVVLGVADAVHIATYYVGQTLVEQLTERFGGPAASAYATRSGGPAGVVPGGMQVVPYVPQAAGGQYGHPEHYRRTGQPMPRGPHGGGYGAGGGVDAPYMHGGGVGGAHVPPHMQQHPHHPSARPHHGGVGGMGGYGGGAGGVPHAGGAGYAGAGPHHPQVIPHQSGGGAHHAAAAAAGGGPGGPQGGAGGMPGQPLTQQIFIPNDMVGAIIGKGGAKINEIRHLSGSVIKINEPQDNSNERLVTITGTPECNQMALYMLYSRLGTS